MTSAVLIVIVIILLSVTMSAQFTQAVAGKWINSPEAGMAGTRETGFPAAQTFYFSAGGLFSLGVIILLFVKQRIVSVIKLAGVTGVLVLANSWLMYSIFRWGDSFAFGRSLIYATGWLAFLLLGFVLAVSALSRLTAKSVVRRLLGARRNMGVMVFALSLIHVFLLFGITYSMNLSALLNFHFCQGILEQGGCHSASVLTGLTAFGIFAVLAATSNIRSVRFLGMKKWKTIHRLTYLCFALIALHVFWFGFTFKWADLWVWFYAGLLTVFLLQLAGFVTVRKMRKQKGA